MNQNNAQGTLVKFQNTVGFHLDGILFRSDHSKKTIIHIHGSYGNFYQANFIMIMANLYTKAGFNFLSFNLTCHDGFAEGYRNENDFDYVGGAVSEFSTCIADIEGAVVYAKQFSNEIILQGHSLGCDRVVSYLLTCGRKMDFILLSPCDSYRLQSRWIKPLVVEEQINRLILGNNDLKDLDWLPLNEYGVYSSNEEYILPITRKALLSIMSGAPFKLFNIAIPFDFHIDGNCFIYLGGKDNLQTEKCEVMFDYFRKRVSNVRECYIDNGDHMLKGFEKQTISKVIQWLKSLV